MNIGGSFFRLDTDVSDNSSGSPGSSTLARLQERYYVGPSRVRRLYAVPI